MDLPILKKFDDFDDFDDFDNSEESFDCGSCSNKIKENPIDLLNNILNGDKQISHSNDKNLNGLETGRTMLIPNDKPDKNESTEQTQKKEKRNRKRYTISEKRDFVERLKENIFLQKDKQIDNEPILINASLKFKWLKAYSLGCYSPELYSNLDKIKASCSKPEGVLLTINRKLAEKFPKESELLEVRYIEDLGYGVFARKLLQNKQSIGYYQGETILIRNDGEVQSDYVYNIADKMDVTNLPLDYSYGYRGVDAKRFDSCYGRYINHPPIGFEQNISSFTQGDIIELRTCKEISMGDQLFLHYGYNYWEGMAMKIVKGQKKKKQLYQDLCQQALTAISFINDEQPQSPDLGNNSDYGSDSDFEIRKKKKLSQRKKLITKKKINHKEKK